MWGMAFKQRPAAPGHTISASKTGIHHRRERNKRLSATDTEGTVQPAPDDPLLAGKQTFWESNGQITRRVSIT